uniref:Uncharacterized protein n=1 Tax=Arundo donax TaxID=35708 RepID=A0A0A9A848_ARUDO
MFCPASRILSCQMEFLDVSALHFPLHN